MHEVQDAMTKVAQMEDDVLMEHVVQGWKTVCEENAAQKDLVTAHDFAQWEQFRNKTQDALRKALNEYDGLLSEHGRATFFSVANDIARATHKSADELEVESAMRELERITKEAQQSDGNNVSHRKKKRWLGLLGGN